MNACLKLCYLSLLNLNSSNLIDIEYSNPSNQVSDEDLFIGDETTAFLLDLADNEGIPSTNYYGHVRSFYVAFTKN